MTSTTFDNYHSDYETSIFKWRDPGVYVPISSVYNRVGTFVLGNCFETGYGECYDKYTTAASQRLAPSHLAVTVFLSSMLGFIAAMVTIQILSTVFSRLFRWKTMTVHVPHSTFKTNPVDPADALRTILREEIGAEAQMTTFQHHMVLEIKELRKALLAAAKSGDVHPEGYNPDRGQHSDEDYQDICSSDDPNNALYEDEGFSNDSEGDGPSTSAGVKGTAYYMEKSVRNELDIPDCTQTCTYTTKRMRAGGLCPKKAVYLRYKQWVDVSAGEPFVECYCQQHFSSLMKKNDVDVVYKKSDKIPIPKDVMEVAKTELHVEKKD